MRRIHWNRLLSWSLVGVGRISNPPQLRGFIAVQMMAGRDLLVVFPVSLN